VSPIISPEPAPTPIPDAVADFKAARFPARLRDALLVEASALRELGRLRPLASVEDAQDSEDVLARLAAARKITANHPERLGGAA
jgi:hypothetical protein